ncbi:MAG: J domain-containing protein, partial [Desulfobacterales bacterium]
FQQKGSGEYSGRNRSDSKNQFSEDRAGGEWDPYRVLGIDRSASIEEIKHAYRDLAGKYHPDKLEHLGDEFKVLAETRFKDIQQAYQELTAKES